MQNSLLPPVNSCASACSLCPALCASRSQVVMPTPCPINGILAVGEAPGADEDTVGEGFAGRAGKTLDSLFAAHGIARRDYGRANIVRCWPDKNRKPSSAEVENCIPLLADFIAEVKPKVIVCVGLTPTAAFMGDGNLYRRIEESRTTTLPWAGLYLGHRALKQVLESVGCHVVPMPHTSPLAWNRNAPDGRKWAEIGREQIALAVDIFNNAPTR